MKSLFLVMMPFVIVLVSLILLPNIQKLSLKFTIIYKFVKATI
jgi:hypothetical protein